MNCWDLGSSSPLRSAEKTKHALFGQSKKRTKTQKSVIESNKSVGFPRDLSTYATGAWISGTLRRRALKALETVPAAVLFPIDFNKAEPFVAYMASPEYEQWKAYKNGAKQAE